MRCDMPDAQFLEFVDLDHPSMAKAAELAGAGRVKQAAREAARAMFAQPFKHPVNEEEIPALAEIIHERFPEQVTRLVCLADNYLLKQPKGRGLLCGASHEEEQALYRSPTRNWTRRGENVHVLGRLYHLTGDRRYLRGAIDAYRRLLEAIPLLPDGEQVGVFPWHPNSAHLSHDVGHLPEKLCHALPYLRAQLKPDDALVLIKGLLAMAEFDYRTCRWDVTHNITLHMLLCPMLVGLLLPALRPAKEWVQFVQRRIEEDFTSRSFVTPDGYFGEGFGYQAVNHNLMFIALRYLKAAGRRVSPKLREVCERSFEFAAAITRADGKCAEFGDAHVQMAHEHYIAHHEILHLAAAHFNREDFRAAAGTPYCEEPMEYNVWLMGLGGFARWERMKAPPREKRVLVPHDFRASGFQFFGLGQGPNAHAGMFACAATHNHAHHDFASIDIYGLGRGLLTDTGVTSYGEESYRDEKAHSTIVPVRRKPLGPRLDRPDHQKTLFVVHRPEIQAACMEHDLYECHRIRRTVCLVNAEHVLGQAAGKVSRAASSQDAAAFWLVVDRVERALRYPGRTEPHDFVETFFHFNAPQSKLRYERASLTCWSQHNPVDLKFQRYSPTDAQFEGKAQRVLMADYVRAYEAAESDANLQITAIVPDGLHSITDMRFFQGFTGEYGGRVKRPAMAYRWQGHLPFVAAYVLVPFRGVREEPYAKAAGRWSRSGDVSLLVDLPIGSITVCAQGLCGSKPKPKFALRRVR